MFGRKKNLKIEKKIILDINAILNNTNIKQEEQEALSRVKIRLEEGQYMPRVLRDFLNQVRKLAVQSKLTPAVAKFYSNIINYAYKDSGWSGISFI